MNSILFFEQNFSVKKKATNTSFKKDVAQLLDNVKDWTRSIEIKYQKNENDSGLLTQVYFPFNPAVCLKTFIYLVFCPNLGRIDKRRKRNN